MRESLNFKNKSFAVYGLGITGNSVVNFLRKNRADKIHTWDDYLIKSNLYIKNRFISGLNTSDYIVMSPGINILKSKFKKILLKNKHKIITDLDLFYLIKFKINCNNWHKRKINYLQNPSYSKKK